MSLRIWMPLTKDLRNIGIENMTIPSLPSSASFIDGKLGKCLTASSSTNIDFTCPSLPEILAKGRAYTLTCWVKSANISSDWFIKLASGSGLWYGKNNSNPRWVINDENNGGKRITSQAISSDTTKWHHIAVVVDKTTTGLGVSTHYIDGKLDVSYPIATWDTSALTPETDTTFRINPYIAQVNDIRLYDHALSVEEVKEIFQGLICHCKLDNFNFVDSSGYGNKGTWNGSTAAVLYNSSIRNSQSVQFTDGLNGYITIPIYLNKDAVTMSVWIKSTSGSVGTGDYHMPFNINGLNYEMSITRDGKLRNGFAISGTRYVDNISNTSIISDKKWHMITATYDGVAIKRYVDGELVSTREISGTLSGGSQTIYVGTYYGTTTQYGNVDICESDLRLYCTALSADDIKSLYQASEKIDKNGNLYAYEFKEQENSTPTFDKDGVIIANTLYDNAYLNDKANIGKRISPNILSGTLDIVATKDGKSKNVNTLGSISAATMTSMAGKVLCLSYDVCCPGDRSSTEQGQTAYQYTRFGVHGGYNVLKSDGTVKSTTYPFANQLEYSGGKKRISQYATLPTLSNGETLSALTFNNQTFDKPATTNNSTWYLRNIKLEICENGSKPTPYIENGAISTQVVGWATGTELKEI